MPEVAFSHSGDEPSDQLDRAEVVELHRSLAPWIRPGQLQRAPNTGLALLIKMPTPLRSLSTHGHHGNVSMSDRSHGQTGGSTVARIARMLLATFSRFSRVRETDTTVPPASAIFFAAAALMPDDPPVMRTTCL